MRCVTRIAAVCLVAIPALSSQQGTSPDILSAVEEFRIQTRNLGLRLDSPAKSQRRTRTRTGSWHGRVFWNFRNDMLDAVPHEVTQTGGDKGILRRNQFGFNVSGPIVIPKLYDGGTRTFFSLSYEGMRETIGRSYLMTVAMGPERGGDFSQTVDKAGELLPIYDPASTRENPAYDPSQTVSTDNLQYLRDPFPGNVMSADRFDPVAVAALRHYPAPNVNIGPYNQNNYSVYSPERNEADGMRGKVDHTARKRHRASVSFSFSNGFSGPAKYYDSIANPGRPDRDYRLRSLSGSHAFTISPNSVNTFRVWGWSSVSENISETEEGGQPFPKLRFSPYLSMGRTYPLSRTARTEYGISDGYSTRIGSHSLRLTGELNFERVNSFWPQYPSGRFEFSRGLTSLPGIVNTGHGLGSYLLGMARFAEASIVEHPSYLRKWDVELQVRDEWEIMPSMTLSLGATVNVTPGRSEKFNRQSTVDVNTINPENDRPGALVFAARDGQPIVFHPRRYPFEPWAAISWSPFEDRGTIIRASFRRSVRGYPLYSGQWGTQGYNGTPTYITQNAQLTPALILSEGLPELPNPIPDLRPEAANDTIADLMERSGRLPTYNSGRVSVEREIPWSFVVTLGYSLTNGKNMFADNEGANPNAIPLDNLKFRDALNEEAFNKSLRPFPQYQRFDVRSMYPVGRYHRSEGYVRVEKKTSQGLSMRMVYEYSKSMNDYSGDELQDYYNRDNEWALNGWSDPHRVSLSYMYELPFGPGKQMLTANDWKKHLVDGWSVSGMTSYSSGDPIQLRAEFNNTGNVVDNLYVNAVQGVEAQVENSGPELWFNPAAFVNPPDFSIGNVSRAHPSLRNPARQNHDLSVTKRFTITSERALEFMGTAFNFVNHANWNQPDADIGTLDNPNENAGRIIGSRGGRVIQLGLRLTF